MRIDAQQFLDPQPEGADGPNETGQEGADLMAARPPDPGLARCEPTLSAVEIVGRLKTADAAGFTDKHLRTVQRAVKVWRGQQARRMIAESAPVIVPRTPLAELAMVE